MLLLVFDEIFSQRAHDGASDRSQETMADLVTTKGACSTSSKSTHQASVSLVHGRGVWIVVGTVGVARLSRELVLTGISVLLATLLTTLTILLLLLVSLVLGVGIIAALVLSLTVVAWVSLRIAGVVGTELTTLLTVLEATLLRGPEGVLATWSPEALVLWRVLLVTLLRIALLFAVATLAVALLRGIAAITALVALRGISALLLTVARI